MPDPFAAAAEDATPEEADVSREMRSENFREEDLVKIDTSKMVVLNCGGPLMDVFCIEGDNALCEWNGEAGKRERHLFGIACLSRLVPFVP